MIHKIAYEALGHMNFGWLDARYHFSFGEYFHADRMQFGALRVINDDRIASKQGFPAHSHKNMEIITYVREGAITHRDNLGNEGRTQAGDIQIMSAGTGIEHAEYNLESEDTCLYQIWIIPNRQNIAPRWETRSFPRDCLTSGPLPLLASGYEEDNNQSVPYIYQEAAIYGGRLKAGVSIVHHIKNQAYLLASMGQLKVDDLAFKAGDGAEITALSQVKISAVTDCEILIIDVSA